MPLNRLIAKTAADVTVAIRKTERAMNGGSVINQIRFSDGRIYNLSLDFPFDLATDQVVHPEIHFTVYIPGDWERREPIEHRSPAERRLLQLLEDQAAATADPREKKNAASLLRFMKDRKQSFPMGRKWWDFTPWSLSD